MAADVDWSKGWPACYDKEWFEAATKTDLSDVLARCRILEKALIDELLLRVDDGR